MPEVSKNALNLLMLGGIVEVMFKPECRGKEHFPSRIL